MAHQSIMNWCLIYVVSASDEYYKAAERDYNLHRIDVWLFGLHHFCFRPEVSKIILKRNKKKHLSTDWKNIY